MARTHDGLMMLLTVGRNHALRIVIFYDVISLRWIDVSCMLLVSFTLLHLYHGSNEDDVFLFLHMYILLAFHTL